MYPEIYNPEKAHEKHHKIEREINIQRVTITCLTIRSYINKRRYGVTARDSKHGEKKIACIRKQNQKK